MCFPRICELGVMQKPCCVWSTILRVKHANLSYLTMNHAFSFIKPFLVQKPTLKCIIRELQGLCVLSCGRKDHCHLIFGPLNFHNPKQNQDSGSWTITQLEMVIDSWTELRISACLKLRYTHEFLYCQDNICTVL